MADLDSYLGYAVGQRESELLFRAEGRDVSVFLGEALAPLEVTLTLDSLHQLACQIAPGGAAVPTQWGEVLAFRYESPYGPADVELGFAAGGLQMRARLVTLPDANGGADGDEGGVRLLPEEIADVESMDDLLAIACKAGASDLHLTSGRPPYLRVDGHIRSLSSFEALDTETLSALFRPITPDANWDAWQSSGDTDFSYDLPGVGRFRCNLFRGLHGAGGVFRHIPAEIPEARNLGLPPRVLDLCSLPKGLILVTGPTGSGKSTSIASMIHHINKTRHDHIVTIEDPIEFVHTDIKSLVNQREVGVHTETFAKALRAALREDPDVVLVGELRDLETVSIALETAETGHLVLATLHTATATSAVDRIVDQFPHDQQPQVRVMLADTLRGVLAQMLLRRRQGGRVAAFELLVGTSAVASLIRDRKTFQLESVIQTSRQIGMLGLNDSLVHLVRTGFVDPLEAYLKAVDRDSLVEMYRQAGIRFERPADEVVLA